MDEMQNINDFFEIMHKLGSKKLNDNGQEGTQQEQRIIMSQPQRRKRNDCPGKMRRELEITGVLPKKRGRISRLSQPRA